MSPFVAATVCNTVNFVAPMACMFTLVYVGKRPLMLISQTIIVLGMIGAFYFEVVNPNDTSLLILVMIFIVGFEFGPGTLGWAYLGEICIPASMGLASLSNWFGTLVISLLFPFIDQKWWKPGYINLVFAGCSFFGLIFHWFYFMETRGKTPE